MNTNSLANVQGIEHFLYNIMTSGKRCISGCGISLSTFSTSSGTFSGIGIDTKQHFG